MIFLKILKNSQESTCVGVSFLTKLQAWYENLYQKESTIQVFSCEFCEIFMYRFFKEHHWATASDCFQKIKGNCFSGMQMGEGIQN